MPTPTHSHGENMSEIQSLADEVQRLSQSVNSWNAWIIGSMAITAVVASCLVIVQSKAITTARSLSAAQAMLLQAKEERLAKELREKDELIATVNERAALADERAAEAKLALEKFKTPRTLPRDKRAEFIKRLKPFPGTNCDFAVLGDVESTNLAAQILNVLKAARWNCGDWTGGGAYTFRFLGLPIMGQSVATNGVFIQILDSRLSGAMDALVDVLKLSEINGVESRLDPATASSADMNVIHIRIGEKNN